jgi:hypothetical protein
MFPIHYLPGTKQPAKPATLFDLPIQSIVLTLASTLLATHSAASEHTVDREGNRLRNITSRLNNAVHSLACSLQVQHYERLLRLWDIVRLIDKNIFH